MTRDADNRTTELREKLDALGIEHTDASYKRKAPITAWHSNGATFCFVESSNQIDLHVENPTPEQAIAATLGAGECELVETESYSNANEVVHVLECSACGKTCEHVNGSYPRCPHCGRKAVKR